MSPEGQIIFNVVFSVAMVLLGWVLNSLRDSIKALHESDSALASKVQDIEVLVAGKYIQRDEFKREIKELGNVLFEKLDKIDFKLDTKADKSVCAAVHGGGK